MTRRAGPQVKLLKDERWRSPAKQWIDQQWFVSGVEGCSGAQELLAKHGVKVRAQHKKSPSFRVARITTNHCGGGYKVVVVYELGVAPPLEVGVDDAR